MEIKKINIKKIAQYCITNVLRTDTDKPGFVHLDFGNNLTSYKLRSIMVALKEELSNFTTQRFNSRLTYHWLVRFDQQVNTPFHLDNAEEQSLLMLGYEPSEIKSELYLADFFKYAKDSKAVPKEYIKEITPIFKDDESLLASYTTKVNPFYRDSYSIVLINNSNPKSHSEMLGVFHKVIIMTPDLNKSRIVNSMIINMLPKGEVNKNEPNEAEFLNTNAISK
ncbi:hypothetical protein ES676_00105 [Bizionia saleffrena]|uniref:Uncharacterized protein n=1 Tax=Bizionia saleffrena TaxID=291189 RepID=A0A8H2LGG3_9FLAO|nr:hypothetical protein [Bizionia saleffrena]TYB80109.1 hypothetical protein ES676_00105 [Bizionia saleffrena]